MFRDRLYRFLWRKLETAKDRWFKIRTVVLWFAYDKYVYSGMLCKSYGIRNIRFLNFRGWHNGSCTFVGEREGKKVFIKRSVFRKTIDSEVNNIETLNRKGSKKHFETCEILGTIHSGRQHTVVESFIDGVSLSKALSKLSNEELSDIFLKLYDVLKFFNETGFIHCDFTPGNVFLAQGKVFITDFEFSAFMNDSPRNQRLFSLSREKLKCLGGAYSLRNGMLDDSYSLMQMINYHCPSFSISHKDIWVSLNLNIGRLSVMPAAARK